MGLRSTLTSKVAGTAAAAAAPVAAPVVAQQFLDKAIDGFPGFPNAREVARKQLMRTHDIEHAVRRVIEQHVRLAGAQGFINNLGGLAALPVTIPANIVGLALLHVRMAAAIAYLRGHELADPRVRAACLMVLLGEDGVAEGRKNKLLPGTPYEVATGLGPIPEGLLDQISKLAATTVTSRVTGKRAALVVTKNIPLIGGGVGGAVDAYTMYASGRFASREFPARIRVEIDKPVADA
jgi:EcsC protein family